MTAIKLPTKLDRAAAEKLLPELKELVDGGKAIALDASGVSQIAAPALQLLFSAQKTATAHDLDFAFADPSEELQTAITAMGAKILLGNDQS